jgi:hypothetical protein
MYLTNPWCARPGVILASIHVEIKLQLSKLNNPKLKLSAEMAFYREGLIAVNFLKQTVIRTCIIVI